MIKIKCKISFATFSIHGNHGIVDAKIILFKLL
jgi:hypothetical protein